jgi:hypothetical protein
MKALRLVGMSCLLALPAAIVFAQAASQPTNGLSRAQVKAETLQALRDGDFEVGDTGRKAYEVYPGRYPKMPEQAGETRAQVKQELDAARRNGDIPQAETGETPREINPKAFPAPPAAPGLTRAEVRQETLAAIRAGDVQVGDSGQTLAELNPSRYAGAPAKPPKLHLHLSHKAHGTASATSAPAH